jgi:hypothetical protein
MPDVTHAAPWRHTCGKQLRPLTHNVERATGKKTLQP